MKAQPLAAIDIGTNTFRLLIAEVIPDARGNYKIKEIYFGRVITRLGKGISKNGLLKKETITKSIAALKKFSNVISRYRVFNVSAIATSAMREAKNRDEFLKRAKEEAGLKIEVISGKEEARKTALGMMAGIKLPETALMVDIGGGSTELIFVRRRKPELVRSLNLGVVYLADRYMRNDPPGKKDLAKMGDFVSRKILSAAGSFKKLFSEDTVFIGTAGTVTALAAMAQHLLKFEHSKIHNFRLTIKKARDIYSKISTITAKERIKYHSFEPERLDIIVPGTLILLKLMEMFGFKEIIVSNYGLREGMLIDLYRKRDN